jgi:hypothetical protein
MSETLGALRDAVIERAANRCEYCQLPCTAKIFKRTVSLSFTASSSTPMELEFQPDMAHTEAAV